MAAVAILELATYQAFSTFPTSDRDIAFFCPIAVTVGKLNAAIAAEVKSAHQNVREQLHQQFQSNCEARSYQTTGLQMHLYLRIH